MFLNGSRVKAKDVSSLKAKKEISQLYLPDAAKRSIDRCQAIIGESNAAIKPMESEIEESCKGVEDTKLLMTIPGIGRLFAAIIYAEVVDIG